MQNVQTAPKLCLGLPEGVCDTSKGVVWTEQKGIYVPKSPQGFSTLKVNTFKNTFFINNIPIPFCGLRFFYIS